MISCAFISVLASEIIIDFFFFLTLVCLVKSEQPFCSVINNVLSQGSKLFQLFNGYGNIYKTDGRTIYYQQAERAIIYYSAFLQPKCVIQPW